MITQKMKEQGISRKGKGLNCDGCNSKIKLILVSGKSHNGKGEFSRRLEYKLKQTNKNIIRCSLSTYIRDAAKNDFYWDGIDTVNSRKFMGEVYRLATELIYPYHMARRVWERDILPNIGENRENVIIVESLREKNNYDYFNDLKKNKSIDTITTIRVDRLNFSDLNEEMHEHISEKDLDDFKFDYIINNDGTLEELHKKVDELIEKIMEDKENE